MTLSLNQQCIPRDYRSPCDARPDHTFGTFVPVVLRRQ